MMVLRQPMNLHMDHNSMKLDSSTISLPGLMQEVNNSSPPSTSVTTPSHLHQHHLNIHHHNNAANVFDSIEFAEKYPQSSSIAPSSSTSTLNIAEKTSRTNLYLKGLPEDFTDERLWDLVPDKSQVKSVKAATEDDKKCRGYGFIDFQTGESAQIALRHIQTHFPLFTIKFAKENEKDKTNLYVTNIPKSWTTKDSDKLKEVFEKFGQIQSAFVMVERSSNKSLGIGFVRFANEDDALNTIDSLKNSPLILPTCSYPVEAKFADKHNPETRRRKHQVITTSSLGLNAAMLGGAGPILGNFTFTPNSISGFPGIPQATGAHPSLAALGLNPMAGTGTGTPGFPASGTASSNLLQASISIGNTSPTASTNVTNDTSSNILNTLGVQSNSNPHHGGHQTFSPTAEQLSLFAAGFPVQNLYGLYGNQFYRPTNGTNQHTGPSTNQNALTSAILAATLNNNASYNNPNNPYSTLVAYQALMNGTTANSNMMSVNTNSIYTGSNGPNPPGTQTTANQPQTQQQQQQQSPTNRINFYHPGPPQANGQDVASSLLVNSANDPSNILQFQ